MLIALGVGAVSLFIITRGEVEEVIRPFEPLARFESIDVDADRCRDRSCIFTRCPTHPSDASDGHDSPARRSIVDWESNPAPEAPARPESLKEAGPVAGVRRAT